MMVAPSSFKGASGRAGCTHELDAGRPLDDVVADLIAIVSQE